ncbi:heme peroxidase [Delitschia confertaspora ATCC 74209]|uniref:Peroxidase n=1 Tax=Delitschia confertaspora ATCC 74209 TaxID=1513339 RepID=A0A9P4JJ50_9PLEO|nr:heme peroxidase [Delitschia confertaspora ATCC 74209]
MHMTILLLLPITVSALSFSSLRRSTPDNSALDPLFRRKDRCPTVWTTISKDLTKMFLSNGECTADARAAIREVFHDCGAWNKAQGAKGGCDGSLILAGELSRAENNGLQDISAKLKALAVKYGVGVADIIVFAGSHAVVTCPGGPQVQTWIGRKDSTTPAPDGLLPDVHASADSLFKLFQEKGFDAVELAALLGAHSTSKQSFVDTSKSTQPQDSTPGKWDVKYYAETLSPPQNVFVFPSDSKLAVHSSVGKEFKGFVNNQGKWNGKFADALTKMGLFGVSGTNGMVDCTEALPKSTNSKREMRANSIDGSVR